LHALTALGRLLILAYLPGALLYRAPLLNRDKRAGLAAEERAFWAVILSLAFTLIVTLGLALIGQYSILRLLLVDIALSAGLAVAFRTRLGYERTARAPDAGAIAPVALAAVCLWLYFPSSEYVMGGKDPGVYLNEGIQIAQRGALVPRDQVVATLPAQFRDLFYPSHKLRTYYGLRFMGFYILDPGEGTILGQFPHVFPASIAIGYGIDGLTGARRTVGFWAILGVVALYIFGSRLVGRRAAFVAALLLAINVVQLWFARYPNSEIVMQVLALAALLASARALIDGHVWLAPVAAVLLSLSFALRYETVLVLAAVGASAALSFRHYRTAVISLGLGLAACLPVAWLYLTRLMAPYANYPVGYTSSFGALWLALTAVTIFAALSYVSRRPHLRRWLPIGLMLVVAALAFYAYFLRQPSGRLAIHDAASFRTFAWYTTRAGLLLAVAGFLLAIRDRFWRDPALFFTAAIFGGFFFWKIRIVPEHFWMTRRFLSVILPVAMLCMAYAAFRASDLAAGWWTSRRRQALTLAGRAATAVVACALVAPLAWQFHRAAAPVRPHVEYAGLIPRLEQLSQLFKDDELVVVESRNASDVHVLALPLAYIYARNVLVLNNPRPDKGRFREFLEWARTRYSNVSFVGGGGTDLLSRSITVSAVASERFQVPEYESPRNAYPTGPRMKEFDFGVYRFVPVRPAGAWFSLDVGVRDDLHVVRFHAKEETDGHSFRWTRRLSYVSLVGLGADIRTLTLWLNDGGRPASLGPAHILVHLDDALIGESDVTGGFRAYSFNIPAAIAEAASTRDEPILMRIEGNVWNPRQALGANDDRDVGVMVDRIEAR
jgi:hypothetical protein